MIYFSLIYEFFKIGLFSFGGGYATVPFLYHIAEVYNWFSLQDLSRITAVASITPGPIGINAATYAGLKTAGIAGALAATTAELLPSLILVIVISKILKNFSSNFYVKTLMETLKPIGCALLVSVAVGLFRPQLNDLKSLFLLAILLIISYKSKKDPLFYIFFSAMIGVVLTLLKIII